MIDYYQLLRDITSGDDERRQTALQTITVQDEDAVTPLIDQFYAGVNESTGLVIIDLLSQIGGFEARQLLEDIYHLDQAHKYASWRESALNALKFNGWE